MSMRKFAQSVSEDLNLLLKSINVAWHALPSLNKLNILGEDKDLLSIYTKFKDSLFELHNYINTMQDTLQDYEKPSMRKEDVLDVVEERY